MEIGCSCYAFAGQSGALDHALASANWLLRVGDAQVWQVNAVEPRVLAAAVALATRLRDRPGALLPG